MKSKNVYTIPPTVSFADTLAKELLLQEDFSPERLARTVLFLPTKRACKTIQEAFLRQSDGRPLMLPRLIAFSALQDETVQGRLSLLNAAEAPEAISPLRRRLLLTKLIRKRSMETLSTEKALYLADSLAEFLDETYIENMPFERLTRLVGDEYAAHWQEILTFLEIVTTYWPEILKQEGVIDPADRQVRLFKAQAAFWREHPPEFPVIAAGSTGSQPATAELLDTIASLENGKVILPGLDMLLDEESFKQCESSHPQYHLKKLLEKMGISRSEVKMFAKDPDKRQERLRLISEAMRPALTTDRWRDIRKFTPESIHGIKKIDCNNVQEEALTIALILREVLETPAKTAVLITPDRNLARRVIAQMKRWNITIDDSAGISLSSTPLGVFLLLLAQAALSNWAPVEMLACLKHPLALGGKIFAPFRSLVRKMELSLLRGKKPGDGFEGLKQAARMNNDLELYNFISDLENRTNSFSELMNTEEDRQEFETLLDAHLKAAEQLAQSVDKSGQERLWTDQSGQTGASFFTELKEQASLIGEVSPFEYVSLLRSLLKDITVRPKYGMHPRLDILGTMEARLIQPDVLILGGLNEGVWPKIPDADPWMSRSMREQCGLSCPETKIALSAHDFSQAFCAKNVIMTRSLKDGGTPCVPSRWLMRLQTVLDISGLHLEQGHWSDWAKKIDTPETVLSFLPPHPTPPVFARPRKLSATAVETLMRDPYAIYARYILKLKKLKDIDEEFNVADFGTIVHKAVEIFCTKHPSTLPQDPQREILEIGHSLFKELNFSKADAAFWKPRLDMALCWFLENQQKRIDEIETTLCEQKGVYFMPMDCKKFQLDCIADRIDLMKDGKVVLIDYKTGLIPDENSIVAGYCPQLPLEAAILEHNGFEKIKNKSVSCLEYWQIKGKNDSNFIRKLKAPPEKLAQEALSHLKELISTYEDENTPYLATPDLSVSLRYNDYEHLARYDEWASSVSDEDQEEQE